MTESMGRVRIGSLIFLVAFSLLLSISVGTSVLAQEENAVFSVSPGGFTARDVPLMGEPYVLPRNIVVWNRDNNPRVVYIGVEVPSAEDVTPGYEPIPSENWVNPFPSSVLIEENSYVEVQISLNIPSWENFTGQKWEVWIPVERQPLPGETPLLRPTVRLRLETTGELPAEEGAGISIRDVLLAVGIAIVIAVIAVGAWIWSRRRGGRRAGRGMLSRSWR